MIRQRWFYTTLPALHVPGGCVYLNRIWNSDDPDDLPVGMLRVRENNYVQDARWHLPAGLTGDHQCNPEWLAVGEPLDSGLPPTVYGSAGIPACCGLFQWEASGGLELGGSVRALVAVREQPAGGLELGGSVRALVVVNRPTAGGFEMGGEGCAHPNRRTSGGLEIGCAVSTTVTYRHAPAGGLELGGSNLGPLFQNRATSGGVELGGTVPALAAVAVAPAGGLELGGSDPALAAVAVAPAGGLELGGSDPALAALAVAPAGGLELGGTIPAVVTGGGPSFGGVTSGQIASQAGITYPTRAAGDELIVFLELPGQVIPAANTGWNRRLANSSVGRAWSLACYTKTSDGTDATFPFTASFSGNAGFIACTVPGATATYAVQQNATGTGSTSLVAPSVTTTGAPSLHLTCYSVFRASNSAVSLATTLPQQSRATLTWHNGAVTTTGGMLLASEPIAASGATGTRTCSDSVSEISVNDTVNVR